MDIDSLYQQARTGDKIAENELFSVLTVRFGLLANHRIWNDQDARDVVQNALTVVAQEYRKVEITVSFAAWAYKVLDNRILTYLKTKNQRLTVYDDDPPASFEPEPLLKIRLLACVQKVRHANLRYGQAVLLHLQGFDTTEICTRLNVSSQNFYMILSRARTMLRRCLETGEIA